MALEHIGVKYSLIQLDLANKPDWYEKKVNPAGKVKEIFA